MKHVKFEEPELTVSGFTVEDIVATSGGLIDGGVGDDTDIGGFGTLFRL